MPYRVLNCRQTESFSYTAIFHPSRYPAAIFYYQTIHLVAHASNFLWTNYTFGTVCALFLLSFYNWRLDGSCQIVLVSPNIHKRRFIIFKMIHKEVYHIFKLIANDKYVRLSAIAITGFTLVLAVFFRLGFILLFKAVLFIIDCLL